MKTIKTHILLFFSIILFSCQSSVPGMAGTTPPSHKSWNELLKANVSADGTVNYKGFIKQKAKLESYLKSLSENAPDRKTWSKDEQLAYWINAYNAFTVKLIVDNYPVESIKDLGPKLKIPLIKDVWHYKFFKIGGQESSLDEIEHSILRKEFEEPRIHFAINCASVSCPPLLNEAFEAATIESQLNKVAKSFINDSSRNKITPNSIQISSIFSWFKGDFTKNGSLIDFLNKYSKVKIKSDAKVSHLDYDWNLNE
ncbi:DUF547 domain-containing protein [Algoriphagus halophytocola]|uniref:DUF547 domain-containing protein n=1 Tax=Algoriphagus halophytocola TaxID=2991499 RepID=A0ABY6MFZ6_9BACT|nr:MULTISPECIES: DUF547 domain-containing protein [unclassified Algoriphagus]UZD22716.1 DUF547 domain-containing protein [Algoriphagus sp. TR-M5]WBL43981.1 DUF547 domain-containing protein [Algoriphagus sp. TR-M9]